jgi:hypothetical protein
MEITTFIIASTRALARETDGWMGSLYLLPLDTGNIHHATTHCFGSTANLLSNPRSQVGTVRLVGG